MRRLARNCLFCCLVVLGNPVPLAAFEPDLPATAQMTAERASVPDTFHAPIAAFDGKAVPAVAIEGAILRRAWRINSAGLTTLQVILPLRQQLEAAGFDLQFECEARTCGGFDFRFEVEVLPGPNMNVNISRYRYLTALRGDSAAPSKAVGVLVSVTAGSAYVQVITADTALDASPEPAAVIPPVDEEREAPAARSDFENRLFEQGRAILDDLDFATGSTDLGAGPYATLAALAGILDKRPNLRLALVGHTDTVGALDTNIALSRARAQSVRDRLIAEFGADGARLDAEGMGYLAPIAPNLTEEGRRQNRRVEVILVREE
ncbi:MAG: OmpA family protein [Pseudomonadota bacterium]